MTTSPSPYAVPGGGSPPLHTQFKKGQSGNVRAASRDRRKLAKQRTGVRFMPALEGSVAELELFGKPGTALVGMAGQMVRDALRKAPGSIPAVRAGACRCSMRRAGRRRRRKRTSPKQLFLPEPTCFPCCKCKKQGNGKQWLEDILWPAESEQPVRADRNEAEPFSLVQE